MILTEQATDYNNTTIFTMNDCGAIFYEIDTDNGPLYFQTIEKAQVYIDTMNLQEQPLTNAQIRKILNVHNVDNNIIDNRIYAYSIIYNAKTRNYFTTRDDVTDYTKQQLLDYLGY